ncbi:MAG: porin family protein [Kiritimatiellae bacterium]|nr:porin family protein [Kiritimatiellia bacterium]
MKKLALIFATVLLTVVLVQAKDIEAGRVELSGMSSASYSMLKIEPEGGDSMDLNLLQATLAGYYFAGQNLGLGGVVTYLDATVEEALEGSDVSASVVMVGPSVKFNLSLSDVAGLYVMGSGGYVKAKVELGGSDEDVDGYFWQAGGGLQYFMNDNVAMNLGLSYQMLTLSPDEADVDLDLSGFTVTLGFSAFVF